MLQKKKKEITDKLSIVDEDYSSVKEIYEDSEGVFVNLQESQFKIEKELSCNLITPTIKLKCIRTMGKNFKLKGKNWKNQPRKEKNCLKPPY